MKPSQTRVIAAKQPSLTPYLWGLIASLVVLLAPLMTRAEEVTISHGYSNFGELKYQEGFAHLDYVNPDAPKGGMISLATQGTFDTFNLSTRKGTPAALTTVGYESMLVAAADDPYGMYCFLCETMEYPEDLSWIIFNLRDDVTFWDGTEFTADDIEFTFNLYLTQGIAEYRAIVDGFIESVEVLDPHRIKFTFTDKAPIRERVSFAGGTRAFSKAWFEETGTRLDDRSDDLFMGTGPYKLGEFEYGREVNYVRAENYWGADHPLSIGQNNYDRVRILYFADSTAALEGFKAGEYTFRIEGSSLLWATAYDFPNLENGHVIKTELHDGTMGTASHFVFNLDRQNWKDPKVREALGFMLNFEWSDKALFYGVYSRVDSFWPGSDLAASGAPTDGEAALLQPLVNKGLLPETILTEDAVVPPVLGAAQNQPSRKFYRQAGKLLDEAGWTVGSDGMRQKDGQPLELDFLTFSPAYDRIINPIIENMERLGVKAKLERVDLPQYYERRRSGEFDLISNPIGMGFEPGIGLEQWFHSKTAEDSSRNLMRLRNPAVDALLPSVVEAKTLDELRTATHAIDRVLRSLRIGIPMWYNDKHLVAYYDMYEHPDNLPPLDLGYLNFWWVNAEKEAALKAAGVLK